MQPTGLMHDGIHMPALVQIMIKSAVKFLGIG